MEDAANFIKEVGFPVAVASFVLFRMNGKFDRLAKSIDRLANLIAWHSNVPPIGTPPTDEAE